MAKITLPPKRKKASGHTRKDIADAYAAYRPLRMEYLAAHPLCEDCLNERIVNENGRVEQRITAATECHHITPITTGRTREELIALATDSENLKAVCSWHHLWEHGKAVDVRFI